MWYSIPFLFVLHFAVILMCKNTFCFLVQTCSFYIVSAAAIWNSDNPWFNSSKAIFCKSTFCASVHILVVMILITQCTYEVYFIKLEKKNVGEMLYSHIFFLSSSYTYMTPHTLKAYVVGDFFGNCFSCEDLCTKLFVAHNFTLNCKLYNLFVKIFIM